MSNFYNRIQIFILHFYCTNKDTCRHLYISKEERQDVEYIYIYIIYILSKE